MLKASLLPDELKKLAEKVSEHDQLAELLNNDVRAHHENINNNFKSDNVDENLKEIGKMTFESNENMKKMEKELFEVKNMVHQQSILLQEAKKYDREFSDL